MLSLRGVWTIRLRGPEGKGGGAGEVMRVASLLFWLDLCYRWERFLLRVIEHIKECWWNSLENGGGVGEG